MIENIKLFLENPKKSKIYTILNVNDNELKILKKMLQEYIEGNEDVRVRVILSDLFAEDKIKALEYVGLIKNLWKKAGL